MNNDFAKIEAEAFAEHQAEQARKQAEEDAKYEREQEARRAKEREEWRVKNIANSKHLRAIAESLDAKRSWAVDPEAFKLTIDGVDCHYCYNLEQEWSRGGRFGWGSKPTGKMRFVVGQYGDRVSYRELKDGTFNYAKIADRLVDYADRQNARARLEVQRARNKSAAKKLAEELFKPDSYQDVITASASHEKPVFFKLKIEQAMTETEARKLAKALQACGVKLHYSEK